MNEEENKNNVEEPEDYNDRPPSEDAIFAEKIVPTLDILSTPIPETKAEVREMAITLKAELTKYENLLKTLYKDMEKWSRRKELAQQKNEQELIKEAEKKISNSFMKTQQITLEYNDLKELSTQVIEKLRTMPDDAIKSVDTDQLIAELEMFIGEDIDEVFTKKKLDNLETEQKLEALKKKMNKPQ